MFLTITGEGNVAKYMTARSVTAFVLKYHVAHTRDDATQEFTTLIADMQKYRETVEKIVPLAVADGFSGRHLHSATRL